MFMGNYSELYLTLNNRNLLYMKFFSKNRAYAKQNTTIYT